MQIGAYESTELIHESARSVVERGVRVRDGLEVVIKSPGREVSTAESVARLRNEWSIARMFETAAVPRVLELVESANEMALVFEGNHSLVALDRLPKPTGPNKVRACLSVALGILDALAVIHAKAVVHKDLKPANVLVDSTLTRVMVIDFGIATVVPRELGRRVAEARFEGTLGFLPPEQTGRVNRPVDYRSDYYGLGATMYWMLIGERPFADLEAFDALLHAQITRMPARLTSFDPTIPAVLADIVAKLLAKAADDRYQGSYGLRADLERCLAQLDERGDISHFEIARVDPSERLRPPRRLHGREHEVEQLCVAADAAADAGPSLVSLRGPSGSGKSVLVSEMRARLSERNIVFATSKFDQFTRASPHAGAGQLLRSLLEQLVAGGHIDEHLLEHRIRTALGPNASLLAGLVPELERMLGGLGAAPLVGPAEARDRFWDTLERFTDALLIPGQEVVVFIDDVQWADASSLRLLQNLCLGRSRWLTLILAWRTDPLRAGHPLPPMFEALDEADFAYTRIDLGPLPVAAVEALVADVLEDMEQGPAFARLLHRRTHGTPLFVAQLLMAHYAEGIVDMDRATGRWRVDMARAQARESSGDVVDFLVGQLEALRAPVRHLLGVAACIGARFDIETLAAAIREPISRVSAALWEAVSSGHLQPLAGIWRSHAGGVGTRTTSGQLEYAFVHDRIQQIARESLVEDRAALYLSLARRLAARGAITGEGIHALADYVGRALELVTEPEERARFSALCVQAGDRARATAGFASAARHYRDALQLTAETDEARAEAFRLHLARAECLAMAGALSDAEEDFAAARARVEQPGDLPSLLHSEVTLAMVKGQVDAALAKLMLGVESFGLDLRLGADQAWLGDRMGVVLAKIAALGDAGIRKLPSLDDPREATIGQLLLSATNAAYLAGDISLYAGLGLAIIERGLEHGVADTTGVAFTQLALVVVSALGDYEGARRYSGIGHEILERTPTSPLWGMAQVIQGSSIQPWVEHMGASLPLLKRAYVRNRATGMFSAAAYAQFMVVANGFSIGAPLNRVLEDAHESIDYLESIGDRPLTLATEAHVEAAKLLAQPQLPAADRGPLVEVDIGDPSTTNPSTFFIIHTVEALLGILFGERERVAIAIEAARPFLAAGTGLFPWVVFRVIALIDGCDRYEVLDEEARASHESAVHEATASFASWESSCPENARPFVHLLAGAWARARGELTQAREAYAKAADAAATSGFHSFEGFANERGAAILFELGDSRSGIGYLEHAARAYARWGAVALESRVHGRLRKRGFGRGQSGEGTQFPTTETIHALDVSSIVKMSLALSEAIHLQDAVAQLLQTASQNAGADRSALLLEGDVQLELHAEQVVGQAVRAYDPPLALAASADKLAVSVVRQCLRRQAAVIIDDARSESSQDPYLDGGELRAILALPIIKHGTRVGVLYLENRVTPGAFTHHHLRVLGTLAVQAAVTLDNARLFDALREREARWRALVDGAPDRIMIVERDHQISFSNHVEDTLSEDLVGRRVESMVAPDERERVGAAIDYVLATGSPRSYETKNTVAGKLRHFTTRLGPIRHEGAKEVERVTLISTDVSDQRELEQQFRQSQKMQAVGTLAGGVAHDFNNLLMIMMGAAELGVMELDDLNLDGVSPVYDSFSEISAAAERASGLTRQLLAFSRKQVLQPKHLELGALVSGVTRMLERLIGEDIELRLELSQTPCKVFVDPGQLEQVVMNLVVNARDAMPRGGTLIVRTRELEPGHEDLVPRPSHEPGASVLLEVIDTGMGMTPELVSRIFEPFFTTKGEGRGTGLGLSTVHGIIEQSGGHISVESELGRGSSFRISLPTDNDQNQSLDSVSTLERQGAGDGEETILVVEDDEAVAALVATILRARGYEVLVAYNHDQAVAHASGCDRIDLVFADVVLPGANGREVAQRIVALHPNARVLYTSGYTDDAIMRHGLIQGTVAFLQKPVTPDVLARELRRVLDAPHRP